MIYKALQIIWYVRILFSGNRVIGTGFLKTNIILLLKYLTKLIKPDNLNQCFPVTKHYKWRNF